MWATEVSIDIEVTPADAYRYLSDFPRHREWSSAQMAELKQLAPGQVAVGTEFEAAETTPAKVITYSRITALEPYRLIAWHSWFRQLMAADWQFDLIEQSGATHLVQRSRWQPGNIGMEVFHRLVRRHRIPIENLHSLERIKAALEKAVAA